MNRLLLALAGILLPVMPALAEPAVAPPAYVMVVRISSIPVSPARILAFQNVSTGQDVIVRRIDISNASTMTVTGGLMQFWVYASTSLVHSTTSTVQNYKLDTALAVAPAAITASTAPTIVLFENDTSTLTASSQAALSGTAVPLIRPLFVNTDETATTSLTDGWGEDIQSSLASMPLVLPHNSSRALVIEKRQLGSSDFSVTAGAVNIRVFYTLR